MAMKKHTLFTLGFLVLSLSGWSQANLLNAKEPETVGIKTDAQVAADFNEPIEYAYVDDRDVLWSKTVWEKVDLDERVNFPYYYPTDTINISSKRRSLYDVLMKNIKNGKIKHIYTDSYFNEKRQLSEISAALQKVDTLEMGYDQINAGEKISEEYVTKRNITAADIEAFHIKGIWYFDKRLGEMRYRILGIAPVAPDVNFIDAEDPDMVELFWVWYPHAREVLHEALVFNNRNSSQPLNYDMMLNARRFSGYIYKEDNVQEDRQVTDYVYEDALMQILESERIKNKIRDFEQDMWEN